jgi:glycosyltransferase involved in cell wall biosynthesis
LLLAPISSFRSGFLRFLPLALLRAHRRTGTAGRLYLNVGHTGLDEAALPGWIARNRIKAIYLVHDLIPITHPEFCRDGEDEKHRRRMRNVLASATGVIGNSHATLADLRRFAGEFGVAVPSHVAAWIAGQNAPIDAAAAPAIRQPYFLVLGTIEERKNHILLLRIWCGLVASLGDGAPRLVVVGQRGWKAEAALGLLAEKGALADHVVEFGHCRDDELARLIRHARALLIPSLAEGFGLPLIEALQLGTPVLANRLPAFEEIAAGIPTFVDAADERAWERHIVDFMTDCPERLRQLAAMGGYSPPNWQAHFAKIERWLDGL